MVTSFSTKFTNEAADGSTPAGIAVDSNGLVYVCDPAANSVLALSPYVITYILSICTIIHTYII